MARRSEGLSERHRKIMEFLTSFQEKNGYAPSIREIGQNIGVKSTSLIDYYLRQLEEKGFINRNDRISRSIRVLEPAYASFAGQVVRVVRNASNRANDLVSIPVWGRIVAGKPAPMPENDGPFFDTETSVEIARSLLPSRDKLDDLFALEVQGESMIDAMVNDGDIIIMKRTQEANNGEMVAIWLDDRNETTLKYFYREKDRIRLQPANPTMKPIYIDRSRPLSIRGKVVMIIRQVRTLAA